jgi:hypothetical protein
MSKYEQIDEDARGGIAGELLAHVRARRGKDYGSCGDDALAALLGALDLLERDDRLDHDAADALRERLLDAVERWEHGGERARACGPLDAAAGAIRVHALAAGIVSPFSHPALVGAHPDGKPFSFARRAPDAVAEVRGEVEALAAKVNDLERHGKVRGDRAKAMRVRLSHAATSADATADGRLAVREVAREVGVAERLARDGDYSNQTPGSMSSWANFRTSDAYKDWARPLDADAARAAADEIIASKGNAWAPTPRPAPASGVQENAVVQMSFATAKPQESASEPGSRSAREVADELLASTYLSRDRS